MSVAERIVTHRKKLRFTQTELSKRSGISQQAISKIENGASDPSTETLALIAAALGCSAAELLGENAETRQPTDNEIKFALFGGDAEEISDEQLEEVKRYAQYLKERKKNGVKRPT